MQRTAKGVRRSSCACGSSSRQRPSPPSWVQRASRGFTPGSSPPGAAWRPGSYAFGYRTSSCGARQAWPASECCAAPGGLHCLPPALFSFHQTTATAALQECGTAAEWQLGKQALGVAGAACASTAPPPPPARRGGLQILAPWRSATPSARCQPRSGISNSEPASAARGIGEDAHSCLCPPFRRAPRALHREPRAGAASGDRERPGWLGGGAGLAAAAATAAAELISSLHEVPPPSVLQAAA